MRKFASVSNTTPGPVLPCDLLNRFTCVRPRLLAVRAWASLAPRVTVVGGGVGVVGVGSTVLAGEVVGLGALAMFTCGTRVSFGSYRLLSPFAVLESYAGVVIGNALSMAAVGLLQMCVLAGLRLYRRVRRQIELMSSARFPALLFGVSGAFHTGTAYASSQLVSRPGEYAAWELAVGAVGVAYCVVYPVVLAVHPYLRIGRAYQQYEVAAWVGAWPAWAARMVPSGAMFSVETRRAYGAYVSAYRAAATQAWWTSHPTWTGSIVGIGGLFHPTSVGECEALFGAMGVVMILIGGFVA